MSYRFVLFGLCCVLAVANGQSDITTLSPAVAEREEMEKKADLQALTPGLYDEYLNKPRKPVNTVFAPDPVLGFFNINQTETPVAGNVYGSRPNQEFKSLNLNTEENLNEDQDSLLGSASRSDLNSKNSDGLDEQVSYVKQEVKNMVRNLSATLNSEPGSKGNSSGVKKHPEICFPKLGCFGLGGPWKPRPVPLPGHPLKMKTTVYFYSRANPKAPIGINIYPEIDMKNAAFDPSKKTVFIIHGFRSTGNLTWQQNLKDVYLREVDANVMIVDWGKGAIQKYYQVAGNTRVVGKELSLFVKYLIDKLGAKPANFHLIGHSLGAQICSYLGKHIPGIGRLTALDPAQPGFEGFKKSTRLDKSDANFVEVIHTDSRPFNPGFGFGMIAPHGHVDFYMNGGFDQPGCYSPLKRNLLFRAITGIIKYPIDLVAGWVSCSHTRAYEFYTEALDSRNQCVFIGHRANTTKMFRSESSRVKGLRRKLVPISDDCAVADCLQLGFNTEKTPLRGVFVIETDALSPFCQVKRPSANRKIQVGQVAMKYTKFLSKLVKSVR